MTAATDRRAPAGIASIAAPALLALAALVLRLPALFASRHLHYDDGVYGLSAVGMRSGARPFEDLFSPQGPLHLVLVFVGDTLGGRTAASPRLASVLAGVLATVAAYAAGARLSGRYGGIVAGGLLATTGTMLWTTGPITGDGIAVALALAAVVGALAYRDRPSLLRAVATGLAMGSALSVKALVVTAALPVGWWLWAHRRLRDLTLAVGAAVAVGLAATLPFGFSRVWDQSIAYHRDSDYLYGPRAQLAKLLSTLAARDMPVLVALGLAAIVAIATTRARPRPDEVVVLAWALAAALVLVFEPAMFRNHIATLVAPLALLVALRAPPPRWLAAGMVVAAVWWAPHVSDVLWPRGYTGSAAEAVAALRALPDGARAISDEPGLVWRAGLATVPSLNDTSIKRIDQGQVTTASVAAAARQHDVCAVVVWSNRFRTELPGLPGALRAAGYDVARELPRGRTVWLKDECAP